MNLLLGCCFSNIKNDPLEFSTAISNPISPRDPEFDSKLKDIRAIISTNYDTANGIVHRPPAGVTLKKDSIPLYHQSDGKLMDRGISIEVVYSVP